MWRFTFAHRGSGGGTKGLFDRYFEMLAKGVDQNHVDQFNGQQRGLRRLLDQFRACGCEPPDGEQGAGAYKDMNWIATKKAPTQAEANRFQSLQAVSGGGAPRLFIGARGVATITFTAAPIWVFIYA